MHDLIQLNLIFLYIFSLVYSWKSKLHFFFTINISLYFPVEFSCKGFWNKKVFKYYVLYSYFLIPSKEKSRWLTQNEINGSLGCFLSHKALSAFVFVCFCFSFLSVNSMVLVFYLYAILYVWTCMTLRLYVFYMFFLWHSFLCFAYYRLLTFVSPYFIIIFILLFVF